MKPSTTTIEQRETVLILGDILQAYMTLEDGVIAIYNQKRRIPPKSGLFMDIAILGDRIYANNAGALNDPEFPEIVEVQTISKQEMVQIDVFSKNEQARIRRDEIPLALGSTMAQQACERHSLSIGRIPAPAVDVSQREGSAILTRFAYTFHILRSYSYARTVPTFDKFNFDPRKQLITNP